jgi:hypothetical protein
LFERLVAEEIIGAWGLTGIGHPDTIIKLLVQRFHGPTPITPPRRFCRSSDG